MLNDFHLNFIKSLLKFEVKFLLIGGYAVISKGVRRTTSDIDFFLQPTLENGEKVIKALLDFGLDIDDLKATDFTTELTLAFGFEPNAVDLVNYMPTLSFEEVYQKHVTYKLADITIPIIDIRELIICKSNLHRTGSKGLIDQYDVAELKKIIDNN